MIIFLTVITIFIVVIIILLLSSIYYNVNIDKKNKYINVDIYCKLLFLKIYIAYLYNKFNIKICGINIKTNKNHTINKPNKKSVDYKRLIKNLILNVNKLCDFLPKELSCDVNIGNEDPYICGQILNIFSILYSIYGDKIKINSNFKENVFTGNINLKGNIKIYKILNIYFLINKI